MKKLLLSFCILLFSMVAFSQPYGNEWINYSQKYFYVKVAKTGVYRLDYNTIINAGVPVSSINPKNFQMFSREKEMYIHVEGEQDNSFDPGDYIEFYAEKNDAWLDTVLFGSSDSMPHTYYSFYNDTLRYYFTWNNSLTNKRIVDVVDTNYTAYTPVNFVMKRSYYYYNNRYMYGHNNDGSSSSFLTNGEGWFEDKVDGVDPGYIPLTINVPTPDIYTGAGAPQPWIETSSASASNPTVTPNHHLQVKYGPGLLMGFDTIFSGYTLIKKRFNVNATDLSSPNTGVQFEIVDDLSLLTDYQARGSATIDYPRTLNFAMTGNYEFRVPFNSSENKSRLDITGYAENNPVLYIINDTVKRVNVSGVLGNIKALVPNNSSGSDAKCYLLPAVNITNITSLVPVNGTGDFTDYASNSIDSAYLILTHSSLLNEANQYAAYRSSPAGGGYNALVVDVEELYDQYGGGIQKHSLGLRRFCDNILDSWSEKPSHLFLLGKGIREATEDNFIGARQDPQIFANNLVPSYGYPPSDALITGGLIYGTFSPAIPTGRLAAKDGTDVLTYLDKIMDYEAIQQNPFYDHVTKAWMKHLLHFGGGANFNEQITFASFLNNFQEIAEDTTFFGGYVDTYLKETSSPINPVDFSEISGFLQEGVSMMTFFGHSSSAGFDQNIDDVTNWNNQGKYPFLLGNGCYAGDIFQPTSISNSEEFVLIPNLGVIAFLATSRVGLSGSLYLFSDEFYKQFCLINYGATVGVQIQNTIKYMDTSPNNISFFNRNVAMQMALHGDPAIKINYHKEPEFVVRAQDIFYDPPIVSLGVDSIDVNVIITNLGKSSIDSVEVELIRHFPNGNGDSIYFQKISGIKFIDTAVFRIPTLHNLATGINIFDASVDIPSFVTEAYDEINNNQTSSTLFINSNGVATIYPYDYAIVPNDTLTFKASTLNPLAVSRNYIFEIDTTDLFNSPFKKHAIINSPGGVIEIPWNSPDLLNTLTGFQDSIIFTDSTVYFWRISPDSSTYVWDESSFQYINGQEGWGQAHFFQFKNNTFQSINYNRNNRKWEWNETYRIFECTVYGFASNPQEWIATEWKLDGALQDYTGCLDPAFNPSIHVAVVDPLTLEAWGTYNCKPGTGNCGSCQMVNADHQFGNANNDCGSCRGRVEKYFIFRQNDPVSMDSMISMYNNHIPDGHYVLYYTFNSTNYSAWQPNVYSFFQSIGADSIYAGRPDEAWIYLTQKGNNAAFSSFVSDSSTAPGAFITIVDTLTSLDYQGNMISEIAGPAARWDALYWQQEALENPTYDSTQIILIGIKLNGEEDTLVNQVFTSLDSIITLNSIVDANIYPYVKLAGFYFDDQLFTPAQTKRWQLLYQPMPEAAINPQLGFYFDVLNDSIAEGNDIQLAVAIENISPYDMDSLLVHYWIEDYNRTLTHLTYDRQDSLRSGEFLLDTITINTFGFPGLNSIWIEANPAPLTNPNGPYDQLEQYHFNNYLQAAFFVSADDMNPILDVTFDGIHILNGDLVSGNPNIFITLKDENPVLIMNESKDTSYFSVYLTDPLGVQKRVFFNQGTTQIMAFTPSTGPNDKFKIEYNPTLLVNGKYRLLIQASDKSGNLSGDYDYKIDFEVDNHPSITHVMNYPNPFSTKTHFVFTLTGTQVPDYMKIQIMTISGKIVREIMVDELGPIRIGRNITEYAWDGRDEFGDLLANGVYLYRVITKINGEEIDKRESGADAYFKHEFGKMMLIR